jgi:precorrin-2 dehydrogenase/sirohydrochlorin ferrochelatase
MDGRLRGRPRAGPAGGKKRQRIEEDEVQVRVMGKDRLSPYYPVFLNISGRKCVVVGGGQVALRKVRGLLECGADVRVVSPDLCAELDRLAEDGEITVLRGPYRKDVLEGSLLAIAATDDNGINREVVEEARGSGVLVNVVDGARDSDFIAPSCSRRGNITLAVSTAGSSPALARKIRSVLENVFGEEYAELADLVEEVRAELRRQEIKVAGDGWQEALDLDLIVGLIKKGEREKARSVLLGNLKAQQERG